jgi:O-antigen/teichoic acid export membrane protein
LVLSIALLVVVAAFGWKLKAFFNFTSVWPFIIVMIALVAAVPLNFRVAYLRGHKQFSQTSIANLIGAAGKILLSAVLVWIGWNTIGAIFGVVLAQVIAFAYAVRAARAIGFMPPKSDKRISLPNMTLLKPELRYGLLVLCGSLTVTVLSSVDIFIVKHFFDAETAGRYAGVSTVARMIFFLTASVAQVLLPSVKMSQPRHQNRQFLLKSLALVLVLGGGATAVFAGFAPTIIHLMMGGQYTAYAHLLGTLSIAMFIISILNLVISYYIALREYQIAAIVVLGAVIAGVLLMSHHETLESVVSSLLYGSTTMLLLIAVWAATRKLIKKIRNHDESTT